MELHESGENYLETILLLKRRNGTVRAIDIANEFGYSKPSISRAMSILKKNGLITIDEENAIELTDLGRKTAEAVYERHAVLTNLLIKLGVPESIAAIDACRAEHVISEETFEAIKRFAEELTP
jgi:Mn-dependent DtxR family transcriptional regulator